MPGNDEERTSLTIPILSNIDIELTTADAELWCPRFTLYPDLTQRINVNKYVTGTETIDDGKERKLNKLLIWSMMKNSDEEFSQRFHKVVTAIINDPTSNAGKKIAKNGWFAQDLSQEDLEKKYKKVYNATSKLLK